MTGRAAVRGWPRRISRWKGRAQCPDFSSLPRRRPRSPDREQKVAPFVLGQYPNRCLPRAPRSNQFTPGDQRQRSGPIHSKRTFWSWFNLLPKDHRPTIVRGDIAYGSESFLKEADQRNQPYLTKVKRSSVVKRLVRELFGENEWENAGQGWKGEASVLTLSGWSRSRRVVALRRQIKDGLFLTQKDKDLTKFMFLDKDKASAGYEYAVLVTSTDFSILTLAQMYRDRADAENNFDDLKNQWDGEVLPRTI